MNGYGERGVMTGKAQKFKISYALKKNPGIDFGCFSNGDGTIKVDPKFWDSYVNKRKEFEILHSELIHKLPFRYKRKNVWKELFEE